MQAVFRGFVVLALSALVAACGGSDAGDANQAPVATITSPTAGTTFAAGDAIAFAGSATDAEDGNLAASRLTWWAELHHDTHSHPFQPQTTGDSGTVTIPTRGETSASIFYRFHLRATDSAGATHEVTRDIQPRTVQVTLTSVPAGLALTLDGQPVTGPSSFTGVVGMERRLGAPDQNFSGNRYVFAGWSDGGTRDHFIFTPAANTTYTATFTNDGPVTNDPPTVTLTAPASNSSGTTGTPITLTATAADGDGSIAGVEFLVDGAEAGEDATSPYSFAWTPAGTGARALRARAVDNLGAMTTSAAVNVTINAPTSDSQAPVTTITSPANLASGLTGTIAVTASATDNVGVTEVEIQVDGQPAGSTGNASPHTVHVDTNAYASGQHVLRARARDAAGNTSAWTTATVSFGGSRNAPAGFTRADLVTGLNSATAFAQAPDGRFFVAEQGGQLRIVQNGTLLATPFTTRLDIDSRGERGLIGVALHPEFATNVNKRWVYLYYTTNVAPIRNRILRVTQNPSSPNIASVGSEFVVAELPALSSAQNHNGGAIHFGVDGRLYVAVGDNADGDNAPLLTTRLGKMLRLNEDGTIPDTNPFFTTASGDNRSIWARGLRNPFTFAVRASDGRMHINDVGAGTWEEINVGAPGADYGWPSTEGPTSAAGITGPLFAYDHDAGSASGPGGFFSGCAITGGTFYGDSGAFPAAYRNSYYFADFCTRFVGRLDLVNGNAAYQFGSVANAPVDMLVGGDGALHVLTQSSIVRFSPP